MVHKHRSGKGQRGLHTAKHATVPWRPPRQSGQKSPSSWDRQIYQLQNASPHCHTPTSTQVSISLHSLNFLSSPSTPQLWLHCLLPTPCSLHQPLACISHVGFLEERMFFLKLLSSLNPFGKMFRFIVWKLLYLLKNYGQVRKSTLIWFQMPPMTCAYFACYIGTFWATAILIFVGSLNKAYCHTSLSSLPLLAILSSVFPSPGIRVIIVDLTEH